MHIMGVVVDLALVDAIASGRASEVCLSACRVDDDAMEALARAMGACGREVRLTLSQDTLSARALLALAGAARANPKFTIRFALPPFVEEAAGIVALVRAFAERRGADPCAGPMYTVWSGARIDLTSIRTTPEAFAEFAAEVARCSIEQVVMSRVPHDDFASVARMVRESRSLCGVTVGASPSGLPDAAALAIAEAAERARRAVTLDFNFSHRHRELVERACRRGDVNRAVTRLLCAVGDTPAGRFVRKDGDNACMHRVVGFLVE